MTMIIDGTNGLTFPDSSQQYNSYYGFKNRIINGAMVIDQRNAGASVTPTASAYTLDRWFASISQSSKFSVQQNAGSVTPPTGFTNYFGVTSLSAYTVGASEFFQITQQIEGFNVADLGWGTASAATVTLSFWVRSSLTGTFGGVLANSAFNRSYPFSFTINAANTWEQKSITIAGDTSGTWLTNNGIGIYVMFSLGAGSSVSGTAGAWTGSGLRSATGAVSVVGTNGATFYITGVQLEKGSTATSFDYRPYTTELQLCQRYLPAFNSTGTTATVCSAFANSSTKARATFPFPVSARSAATGVTVSAGSHFTFTGTTTVAGTSVAFHTGSTTAASFDLDGVSGLTTGQGGLIYCNNSTGYLLFTGCEL